MSELNNTTILVIEEGAFKGLKMLLPTKDLNKPVHYALVEKGVMFGNPHFHSACLIHEEFTSDQGCEKCIAEEKK